MRSMCAYGVLSASSWARPARDLRARDGRPRCTAIAATRALGRAGSRSIERRDRLTALRARYAARPACVRESLARPAEITSARGCASQLALSDPVRTGVTRCVPSRFGSELLGIRLKRLRAVRTAEIIRLAVMLGMRRVGLDDELVPRDRALGPIPNLGFARFDQRARLACSRRRRARCSRRRRRRTSARSGEKAAEEEEALDSHAPQSTCLPPIARGSARAIGGSYRLSPPSPPSASPSPPGLGSCRAAVPPPSAQCPSGVTAYVAWCSLAPIRFGSPPWFPSGVRRISPRGTTDQCCHRCLLPHALQSG